MIDYEKLYLKAMNRVAELEAALKWHDASEPPEINVPDEKKKYHLSRMVEVQTDSGEVYSDRYDYSENKWVFISGIIRWRDLPQMPGKESR